MYKLVFGCDTGQADLQADSFFNEHIPTAKSRNTKLLIFGPHSHIGEGNINEF
jgi:hypothetical protein